MNELLAQAFELMLAGMGFVFVFLALLILATGLMSRIITKYVPEPAVSAPAPKAPAAPAPAQVDAQLLAVIAAAVKEHRSRHKK